MSEAEQAAFEAELLSDESLAAAFESYSDPSAVLSGLKTPAPEHDLVGAVEARIRQRSRGRFFHPELGDRMQLQMNIFIASAVLLLIGIAVIASPIRFWSIEDTSVEDLLPDAGDDDSEGSTSAGSAADEAAAEMGRSPAPAGVDDNPFANVDMRAAPPRQGAVSDDPVRVMRHIEPFYDVEISMNPDDAERRLGLMFGPSVVVPQGGGHYDVRVPRIEMSGALQRLIDAGGRVAIERRARESQDDAVLTVTVVPPTE